jgi:hypothetical protein
LKVIVYLIEKERWQVAEHNLNTFACVHREDALCVLESFCSGTNWSCIGTHLQMNNKINKILLIYWYDERNLSI